MAILRLKIVYMNRESPAEPTAEMTRGPIFLIFLVYKNQTAQQKPRDLG